MNKVIDKSPEIVHQKDDSVEINLNNLNSDAKNQAQDVSEKEEKIKFHAILRDEVQGYSLIKAVGFSTLVHPVAFFLIFTLISSFGINVPCVKKNNPVDMEFVFAKNIKEQEPINKKTKFRANKNLRAGGKHDPKKEISVPKSSKKARIAINKATPKKSKLKKVKPEQKVVEKVKTKLEPKKVVEKQNETLRPKCIEPKESIAKVKQKPQEKIVDKKSEILAAASNDNKGLSKESTSLYQEGASGEGDIKISGNFSNLSGNGKYFNPGPGNPDGPPGVDAIKDVNFTPYMIELQKKIKRRWAPPMGAKSRRVVLYFKIRKDGKLMKVKVHKTSGIAAADRAAIFAVKRAKPFDPLPKDYEKEFMQVVFTFDSNVFNTSGVKI